MDALVDLRGNAEDVFQHDGDGAGSICRYPRFRSERERMEVPLLAVPNGVERVIEDRKPNDHS